MIKAACTRPRCTMPIAYLQRDFIVKDLRTTGECQILLIHNTVDGLLTITSRLLNFEERQRRSTEVRMRDINNAIHGDIDKMLTITTCMSFQYKLCIMLQFYNSHCQAERLMDIVRKVSVRAEVVCVFVPSGSGARRWTDRTVCSTVLRAWVPHSAIGYWTSYQTHPRTVNTTITGRITNNDESSYPKYINLSCRVGTGRLWSGW